MVTKTRKSEVETASSENALSFIQDLQKEFAGKRKSKAEKERLRQYLAKFEAEKLRSIARRVMIDLVSPPVQTIANAGTAAKTARTAAEVIPLYTKKRPAQTIAYGSISALQPPPSQRRQGGKTAAKIGGTVAKVNRLKVMKRPAQTSKRAAGTRKSTVSRSRRKSAKS